MTKYKYLAQLFQYKVRLGTEDVLIGSATDSRLYRIIANWTPSEIEYWKHKGNVILLRYIVDSNHTECSVMPQEEEIWENPRLRRWN